MPIVQHRARRLSDSSNTDDLHAEIESLQRQLDTTETNLATLRGTNNRLNDRIQKLEGQLDDGAVHVQTQERDINSLRRQLRISSAEITRLRTEKDVLEREYEVVQKDVIHEQDEQQKLLGKIIELEGQVVQALNLHVASSSRTGGADENGEEKKQPPSWLDVKAKLRETENELDAVMQERDWLETQLEKFIHAKDALDSNFSIKNLKTRTSMSSLAGESIRSFGASSQSSRRSSTSSSSAPPVRQSLGEELGLEWNGDYDSDADSDASDSTERADNDSEAGVPDAGLSLSVPRITADDDAISVASSSKRNLKDFAMRLDTSGRNYRSRSRAPSFASSRAPSVAASIRSRMSTRSLRPGSRLQDLDDIPPAPVTATAVFHEIERQHDAKVARLQHDIVSLSTDLQGEIEILQQEVNTAREERDVCVLEIQRLNTELNVVTARHEDSIKALEATLAATAAKELSKPNVSLPQVKEAREVREIAIQTDDLEPIVREVEVVREVVKEVVRPPVEVAELPKQEVREIPAPAAVVEVPVVIPVIDVQPAEPAAPNFHEAFEAEMAALREKEQERLAENLKLKSDLDIVRRDLREKDTLLKAEVIRLEKDLDDLIRDNRNMKDDAEINHYKVENLADELDRTRELLQIQAGEKREFMEEIEQLEARNRELELQLRIRLATPSPIPSGSYHSHTDHKTARFSDMAPFIFPIKDSSSAKSDFEDMLDRSEDEFALASDSESDLPPPSPIPIKQKRRKSSSAKHKHHSKKEKKKDKEKDREMPREVDEVETPQEPTRSRRNSRIPSVSKIPTVSKIPSVPKSNRKSMTLPRSASAQLPGKLKSPRTPLPPVTPPPEPQFEMDMDDDEYDDTHAQIGLRSPQGRNRSSTLPLKIPRPSINFRGPGISAIAAAAAGPAIPDAPQPDKTYWKDLMIGGYAMPPHEYNKQRREIRQANKNMQIKVTAKGIQTKGRVGTGAGFGVGNYADQPDLKPAPKKKFPKRRTSFSDDEAYTHKERSGWLAGMFRKQG